jgi:hypothetical protein
MTPEGKGWRVSRDEDTGVVRTHWLRGAVCGIEEARAVDAEIRALAGTGILSLVDLRLIDSIDRPAREYFMDLNPDYRATALLASSAPTRMLANFFLSLKRGANPVRMFTSEDEALAWLQAHR